ncbi:glycosyltransferase [Candidatus Uhrbacteria bacterium]|nr:glycosyltransferase [Candidatus Uhrbacteria bacterium]
MLMLDVNLLTWNGARYLPKLFASLRQQTCRDWALHVRDNGSTDGTWEAIADATASFPVPVDRARNTTNLGFAVGHNQLLAETSAPFVLLLNQDTILAPDYCAGLLAVFAAEPRAAAAQGVLLRWQMDAAEACERSVVIDTLGLRVLRNRRVVEWHAGERWPISALAASAYTEVFGISGALAMYRRAALAEVAFSGEVLDADFVSYKEDVDLAFRLRTAGWSAYLASRAQAWHDRTASGPRAWGDVAAARHRVGRTAFVRRYSYRNHLAMLIKNEHAENLVRDWPAILWYEGKKFLYLLLREPATLGGLRDLWRLRDRWRAKRAKVMGQVRITPTHLRRWFR